MRNTWLPALALWFSVFGCSVSRGGEIVVTAADFSLEVGTRLTFAIERADGTPGGQLTYALTGERTVGGHRLFREPVFFKQMQPRDTWLVVTDNAMTTYASLGAKLPTWECRLPVKKGATHEYDSAHGRVTARVEGPEDVEVPAGKFTCLVWVEEHVEGGRRWTQKTWFAPGAGTVQFTISAEQDYTLKLLRIDKPRKVERKPGETYLSHFDSGNPLVPLPFPKAQWYGAAGNAVATSIVEIDPRGGAAGTPFCLRWTYHTKGTWVGASFFPGGSMGVQGDMSGYDSFSFYIKALRPGSCSLSLRARKAQGGGLAFIHIPITLTAEWQKVTVSAETHPQLKTIDLKAVNILSISDYNQGEASNVIWLDEFILHKEKPQATF